MLWGTVVYEILFDCGLLVVLSFCVVFCTILYVVVCCGLLLFGLLFLWLVVKYYCVYGALVVLPVVVFCCCYGL